MKRSDEEIREDVIKQLIWDSRIDATGIRVNVENGSVRLSGVVPSYLAQSAAFTVAWSVGGVRDVVNELVIRHPDVSAIPPDEEVRARIQNVIAWNSDVPLTDIRVNVHKGVATIEGTVDSLWKVSHVETLVAHVQGVTKVENDLAVVPNRDVVDQKIASEVMAALARNPSIPEGQIGVEVADGVVTLSGVVPSFDIRQSAYQAAMYTAGVRGIRDNMMVSRAA